MRAVVRNAEKAAQVFGTNSSDELEVTGRPNAAACPVCSDDVTRTHGHAPVGCCLNSPSLAPGCDG